MRVGIFTDSYVPQIGGVSTASQIIKKHLIARGHEAYVITTSEKDAESDDNVIRIPSLPFPSEKRMGINIDPKTNQEVQDLQFDLIHTQTEYGLGTMGRKIAKKQGIPLIHTFHTLYDSWMYGQLGENILSDTMVHVMNTYLKSFLKHPDVIIVPSIDTLEFMDRYKLRSPVKVLPTGIELDKFYQAGQDQLAQVQLRKELDIPQEAFLLVYIGRVSEEKSISEVLNYVASVLDSGEEIYFLLVGSGAQLSEYQTFVQERSLEKYIRFIGKVPISKIQNYYAIGDAFACTSKVETQGLTYIEALATGLPLLVYPSPVLEGVLDIGNNGLAITNEQEFAEAIQLLKYDLRAHKRLSKNALISSQEHSVEKFIDELISIYEEVLENFKG